MKVSFHCFAYGVRIDQDLKFPFRDMLLSVSPHKVGFDDYELILQLSRDATSEEFLIKEGDKDFQDKLFEDRMRPYREVLTEAAHLVEGLFSIFYLAASPKFLTDRIVVNFTTETPEEEELLKSGKVSGGFGHIFHTTQKPFYKLNDKISSASTNAIEHLPALSFLAQGTRAQVQDNPEVAFFLFFRIIEGYFSDGDKDVENALLKKSTELSKYINYNDETKLAIKSILSSLKLKSKSDINFEGLISDIVLIRHKLTHFSKTNASRHHQVSMKLELSIFNFHLRRACVLILFDQMGIK